MENLGSRTTKIALPPSQGRRQKYRKIPLVAPTPLPLGANGIQLINEDNRWSFLFGQGKGVTDQLGTIPDEHLHQLGASQLQKGGLGGAKIGNDESHKKSL